MAIITFTTDFGTQDAYVGIMKGLILAIAPQATLVDITHEVPPQDLLAGAMILATAAECFPPDTIHLAVVDPGVGGQRSPVAITTKLGTFVGPDNGLFSAVLEHHALENAVVLDNPNYHRRPVSHTFHGRDIFAPVAGHLAAGVPLGQLGSPLTKPIRFELNQPTLQGKKVVGRVIHVDRFGNLITNIQPEHLPGPDQQVSVQVGGGTIKGVSRTFSDVPVSHVVAYFGSGGRLEIAVRNGSAALSLKLNVGATVTLSHD